VAGALQQINVQRMQVDLFVVLVTVLRVRQQLQRKEQELKI
jgi:hypothetical protein